MGAERAFEKDPRRQQELLGRPLADEIYGRELNAQKVSRMDGPREEGQILDREFAIDAVIELPTGQVLTCQEKFLSYEFSKHNSVTVEYMQDPVSGERGDWFRIACEMYFVAYFTADMKAFIKWAMLDMAQLKWQTARGWIKWNEKRNMDGRARASFRYVDVDWLPPECVIEQDGFVEECV